MVINRDSHEVKTIDGKAIQLTALEFGILYLLASHPNRVFSADEIFERVWQQESIVSAKTVMFTYPIFVTRSKRQRMVKMLFKLFGV